MNGKTMTSTHIHVCSAAAHGQMIDAAQPSTATTQKTRTAGLTRRCFFAGREYPRGAPGVRCFPATRITPA
ncbi:hypothetical protein ACIODT_31465 [Streptomyces sp. NPDC088251]|uniref:hypothetical protein n=1 Tax=unclassified Streptomyces TaxID=2593676 RepID=UPI0033C82666